MSIARALALAPRILLLDEPFSALDAPTRAELLADLRDVLASIGAASLLVTHDRHEAAAIADRVAILHAGELRQLGPTASVLEHPADADCARLLGFENLLESRLASRLLGEPASHCVAVRARDVAVVPGGDMGVVERVLPFGERTRIATRVDGVRVLSDVDDPGSPREIAWTCGRRPPPRASSRPGSSPAVPATLQHKHPEPQPARDVGEPVVAQVDGGEGVEHRQHDRDRHERGRP